MYLDTELANAAWYYPAPFDKAKHIKDYVAFCECCCSLLLDIAASGLKVVNGIGLIRW